MIVLSKQRLYIKIITYAIHPYIRNYPQIKHKKGTSFEVPSYQIYVKGESIKVLI